MARIRVYSTRWCGYCVRAKALLDEQEASSTRSLARRRSCVPPEALRSHRRLDGPADPDRRQADRRLHRALAARARRTASTTSGRGLSRVESLAGRAVPRAATRDADLVDRRSAARARLAFAAVDAEAVLHAAAPAVRGRVVAEARALPRDASLERGLDRHGSAARARRSSSVPAGRSGWICARHSASST